VGLEAGLRRSERRQVAVLELVGELGRSAFPLRGHVRASTEDLRVSRRLKL
jgi:glycyl-tRNA synthetase (class II)